MDDAIATKLISLNREFYQTFAVQFSATRMRLQPGVKRILEELSPSADILDLGCGNGELSRELARRGYRSRYLGLDFSSELLDVARRGVTDYPNFSFIQGDLADPEWQSPVIRHLLSVIGQWSPFTTILAFATLHHLPGRHLHLQTLKRVRSLLAPGGCFIHSNWQFLNSAQLCARIQPWEEIGLTPADVDPGDYLLDWRQGGRGLRYVHHFSEEELGSLAEKTGFKIIDSFYSDGEGGNLGLYQLWMVDK